MSSSFSWCSTGGPGAQLSAGSLYHILSPTSLISNSLVGYQRPLLPGGGFPYDILFPTNPLPVFTELYNSSIIYSIFRMASLIVIKWKWLSCSSQVTLFRCISLWVYHGIFTLSHFFQPSLPTLFLLITAIGMCHFLLVHHFGMACLAGSKVNIQHIKFKYQRFIFDA